MVYVAHISNLTSTPFDVCLLCGCTLQHSQDRRSKTVGKIRSLLKGKWIETEFSWRSIYNVCQGLGENDRLITCTACTNWLRRGETCSKHYLPIDRLIVYSLNPSDRLFPDLRNMKRLIRVLNQVTMWNGLELENFYLHVLPSHLRRCVRKYKNGTEDDSEHCISEIIYQWWSMMNNSSVILSDASTSTAVRKYAVKRDGKRAHYKKGMKKQPCRICVGVCSGIHG